MYIGTQGNSIVIGYRNMETEMKEKDASVLPFSWCRVQKIDRRKGISHVIVDNDKVEQFPTQIIKSKVCV